MFIVHKAPAYAKNLSTRLQFDPWPTVMVCQGADAWNRAKPWLERTDFSPLVIDPQKRIEDFNWSIIEGLDCVLLHRLTPVDYLLPTGKHKILGLGAIRRHATILVNHGAESVFCSDDQAPAWNIHYTVARQAPLRMAANG